MELSKYFYEPDNMKVVKGLYVMDAEENSNWKKSKKSYTGDRKNESHKKRELKP